MKFFSRFHQAIATNGLTRITLVVEPHAFLSPSQGGVELQIRTGWNSSCEVIDNRLTLDELRGLHYLIGRVIATADAPQ